MSDSRIPAFFRKPVADRLETLVERGFIDPGDVGLLRQTDGVLPVEVADRMVENVISVFGLPLAVAPNFLVNGRDYVVPMVVEEPSVVAGVSGAARLIRHGGGFVAKANQPILIGQVQLVDVTDPDKTIEVLKAAEKKLLQEANELQPNLQKRGGGARSIEFLKHCLAEERWTVMAHIAVDTREFSCTTPNHINDKGFLLVPMVLTVGDYILSDQICVERKSVSTGDLFGSFQSGRLLQ